MTPERLYIVKDDLQLFSPQVMLKLGSWLWTRPTCWISFIKVSFSFYTLCIDMVVAFLAQNIHYSGDRYWKGLATHLSNLCYGMLQEGQCILHVGWISQVENIVSTEGCSYPFFNSYSPAHLHTIHFDKDLNPLGESHFPVSFYQL